MLKRSSKRYRPEDGGCPAPVDADLDFNAKTREFITLCERTSLDLQETRARHKVTMELVEQRNKELEAQKTEHAAAMEAEYDATQRLIDERDELTVSHNAVVEEFRAFKARDTGEADKFRRLAEQLTAKCEELREQNERLAEDAHNEREQNERLAEEVRNEHNGALKLEVDKEKLVTERDKLKGAIKAAQETFHDCITLQNRPGVLLTSGQMLDLEGIVSLWLNSPRFNGDIWFPFQCPLTYRTTTPVHELTTLDFIDRMGRNLNLSTLQALFFQHKGAPLDCEHQGNWRIYTLPEQLQIFSKLVLAYQRRDTGDAGFTVEVRPGHTLSVHVKQHRENGEILDYEFAVTLNVTSFEGNRGVARQHCVQLAGSTEVVHRHFAYCNFVYPVPPVEII